MMADERRARPAGPPSYLPALTDAELGLHVRSLLDRGLVPGVEHTAEPRPGDHYWSLWKLPLFDARTAGEVVAEVAACLEAFPRDHVRLVGYDPARQCQVVSLLVRRP